jgi:hypothetical protein
MSTRTRFGVIALGLGLGLVACEGEHRGDPGPPLYQTVTANRASGGESDLSVRVKFGGGKFALIPLDGDALYRASLTYDSRRFSPLLDYDAERRRLEVGIDVGRLGGKMNLDEQRLDLALGRGVPTDLSLELGAAQSTIELGGLSLSEVRLATGASETTVSFAEANPAQCSDFTIQGGATSVTLNGLANSRCSTFDVAGGAGEFKLDFTGDWGDVTEVRFDLKMGMGSAKFRFAEGTGVELTMDKFLVEFTGPGFVQNGRRYVSNGFEDAATKVYIDVSAALGEISVEWVDSDSSQ